MTVIVSLLHYQVAKPQSVIPACFVLSVFIICAYGSDVRSFLLDAYDLGMMNGEYAFFTNEVTLEARFGEGSWMGDDGRDEDAIKAFNGKVTLSKYPKSPC